MSVSLSDTNAAAVDRALILARRMHGGPTAGHVLTLIVAADGHDHDDAVEASCRTAGEHPSRILVIRRHPGDGDCRLDAEVFGSGERGPGELVLLDLRGELADQVACVVVPLLLPDTPVVTYWPGVGPANPAEHPLGAFANRRVTDLAASTDPKGLLQQRAACYAEGDTDLAWTRITLWRSLLATAVEQDTCVVHHAEVAAEAGNSSAELLAVWLETRLHIPVTRVISDGPGLTEVVLGIENGEIAIRRTDGRLAMLRSPGHPERPIALKRRNLVELMSEELRQLNPDDIYGECLTALAARNGKGCGP
jgi:glucose-6-phosphate dehydrogenase assembly protein OpcA